MRRTRLRASGLPLWVLVAATLPLRVKHKLLLHTLRVKRKLLAHTLLSRAPCRVHCVLSEMFVIASTYARGTRFA